MSLALRAFLSTGSPQADEREGIWAISCFGTVAALLAFGWVGAVLGSWPLMVKIASLAVLGTACCTVWSTNRIWDVPSRSFRRSLALWLGRVQDVLEPGGHAEARVLSHGTDLGGLVVAVEAMARSERPLASEIEQGIAASGAVGASTAEILEGLESLATGMRAITQHIARTSTAASGAAQAAFVASKSLGEVSAGIASVGESAAALKRILSHPAPEMETLLMQIGGLTGSAEESNAMWQRFVSMLAEQDGANGELDRSMAVHTQEVADLLAKFGGVKKGMEGLHKNLEAIQTLGRTNHVASATVWQAAEQFPGRAETIARLLRGLPKFPPEARRHGT